MTTPAHPNRMLFVNLPVENVARTKAFFTKLGFTFNPLFSDEKSTCMLVGEQAFIMLLERDKFMEFSKLPIGDHTKEAQALFCFSAASREEVDSVLATAIAEGSTDENDAQDYGFMYSRSFIDPDGHGWQFMWMDPIAAEQGPEAYAASMEDAGATA